MDDLTPARREVITRLCAAHAAGVISVDQFEDRHALVSEASSLAALEALVADLAHDATPLPLTGFAPRVPTEVTDATHVAAANAPMRIPAIVGSATRAGQWVVPDHLEVMVVLGELKLDFREALFTADTVVLDVSVTLGSLKIKVPPGTTIVNECHEVLTSSSYPRPRRGPVEPNGITLILQGRVVFGELELREQEVGPPPTIAERLGLTRGR